MPTNNHIDYVELPSGQLGASKTFYAAAFGWTFTDYGPSYAAFENAGLDGGLQGDEGEATGAPLIVVYADDIEATLEKVTGAGAEITAPIFEFPGGRRFHFRDPSGNELAVWSAH